MNFISPLWLFAIAAVSIPITIHLWNIRPGKTLKVGSISLISATSRKQSRSFNLLDILLLLLRCLMLCLLAFFLALPYYKQLVPAVKNKGWLLFPAADIKEIDQKFKPLIDSLLKEGYEPHDFKSGFPLVDIPKALADTAKTVDAAIMDYWELLRQLDSRAPSSLPVYLITPGTVENFEGKRPELALNIHWKIYAPTDSSKKWIHGAWFTADKTIHAIQGISKASGTFYSNQTFNPAEQKNSPFIVDADSGKPVISLKHSDQKPVIIDTAALTIDVFADNDKVDRHYLKAVLQTIGRFSQHNLLIRPYNALINDKTKGNWLFWLSEKPLNNSVITQFKNILLYQPGKAVAVSSWISAEDRYAVTPGSQLIPLYKVIDGKNYNGELIWQDGFGDPVLGREVNDNTKVYSFYSRFNPSWSDLVWNAGFPKMMLRLVLDDRSLNDSKYDRRIIDAKQIQPQKIIKVKSSLRSVTILKDMSPIFWILLVLSILTERWLAHKTRHKPIVDR